jgi:plastocyanin
MIEGGIMRLARKAVPIALFVVFLMQSAALATTVNIQASNTGTTYFFSPKTASVPRGATAMWKNTGTVNHTTTSDTTMPLAWDSGTLTVGSTFSFVFTAAGMYTYHCSFHGSLGMVGTVSVPLKASPSSGTVGTLFTITVASANATGTRVYDIQMKVPGGTFQNWKTGITAKSVTFNSAGMATGTYQFQSRLRDTATGKTTLYSSPKSIMVT